MRAVPIRRIACQGDDLKASVRTQDELRPRGGHGDRMPQARLDGIVPGGPLGVGRLIVVPDKTQQRDERVASLNKPLGLGQDRARAG